MKLRLYQAFLAGVAIVLVFAGSVVGLDIALQRLFPQALGGMAALLFGPPAIILDLVASLVLSIGSGVWILRQWSGKSRLAIIIVGVIAAAVWCLALSFAFPTANHYLLTAVAALIGGIIFAFETVVLSTRKVAKVIISLLLIAGGAWVASVQYNSGTLRAQLDGLKNAGFTIYIPADTSGRKVQSIYSTDNYYVGHKATVIVNLASGRNMIEQKVDHLPTANCGSPFITVENAYNTDAASLKDFSCSLVASHNGVEVYLLEKKTYASYYNDYDVSQAYFAVAGSTLIYGGDSLTIHDVLYPKTQTTPEQVSEFEASKAKLLELIPVSDFSPYLIKH